jgi:hypothetical protein
MIGYLPAWLLPLAGVLAALLVLTAYYGLETGRLKATDPRYYAMNAVSSVVLIITIASQFDAADLGAVVMETCWLAISLKGLWRNRR